MSTEKAEKVGGSVLTIVQKAFYFVSLSRKCVFGPPLPDPKSYRQLSEICTF